MTQDYVVVNGDAQTIPNARFVKIMEAVLARGAPFRFQASGFSMSPFIRDGDVITIAPRPARLRLGDVAAFVNPCKDRLTVHRIVGMRRGVCLMRGDHALEPDGSVVDTAILGRVMRVEHHGQTMRLGLGLERVAIAFLSRHGWLMAFLAPAGRIFHFIRRDSESRESGIRD